MASDADSDIAVCWQWLLTYFLNGATPAAVAEDADASDDDDVVVDDADDGVDNGGDHRGLVLVT